MSAAFVSESGVDVYNDIAAYLTRKMSRKIEFVSGLAYGTINGMLETGTVALSGSSGELRDSPHVKAAYLGG